jgi:acetyltransferase-like isoleucine patch superfamily enzyme
MRDLHTYLRALRGLIAAGRYRQIKTQRRIALHLDARVEFTLAADSLLHVMDKLVVLTRSQKTLGRTHIQINDNGRMIIEGKVLLYPCSAFVVDAGASLKIGGGTYIGDASRVICQTGIDIGRDCALSWEVQIMDSDLNRIEHNGEIVNKPEPIRIEDHVWIGSRTTILKGVVIGEGAVIGCNSVVTRSIPPLALAAGNPCRVIREGVSWKG